MILIDNGRIFTKTTSREFSANRWKVGLLEEMEKNNAEQQELNNLWKIKLKLQREKDLCKKECDKLENEL